MALAVDETFGTIIPGFVTDLAGMIVCVLAGTRRDVVPGFLTDDDGRLVVAAGPGTLQDGFYRDADYALCIGTDGAEMGTVVPGFKSETDGTLTIASDPAVSGFGFFPGFVLDEDAALAITT